MSSINVNSTTPMNILFENIDIDARYIEKYVIQTYPEASKMMMITDKVASSELRKSAFNRKVEMYFDGIQYPNATIATATQSGPNLVLTFTDNTFFNFRPNEKLRATSGVLGNVISRSAGSVVVEPFLSATGTALTALTAGTDFAANESTEGLGLLVNRYDSGTQARLIYNPYQDHNWIEIARDTADVSMEELGQGTYIYAADGTEYYAKQVYINSLKNVMKYQSTRLYDGIRGNNSGTLMSGGLPWQIQNMQGTYRTFDVTLSETEIQALINQMKRNNATQGTSLGVIAGMDYIGMLQTNVLRAYILPTGIRSTFGGASVQGIDSNVYAYNGKNITVTEDPMLSVREYFASYGISTVTNAPMMGGFSMWIDTSATITDGGKETWVKCYYYGPEQGMWSTPVNGLIDENGNKSSVATNSSLSAKREFVYSKLTQLTNPAAHAVHKLTA